MTAHDNGASVKLSGCILPAGTPSPDGYVRTGRGYAHRLAYEAAHGPIPDGLEIDHTCRNRSCCNPEHLEAVTHAVNIRRAHARSPHGTTTAYRNYGCRCDVCRQANREWHRAYRERRAHAA